VAPPRTLRRSRDPLLFLLVAPALALGGAGCIAPRSLGAGGYCAPPSEASFAFAADAPPPVGASRAERTAALLGLRDALAQRDERDPGDRPRIVALERIELARLAIGATAAELRCESARAKQGADAVASAQSGDVQALTIASIGASAVTGIAGVFLSTHQASAWSQETVAVAGGGVTAGLALASLVVHPLVAFAHERNLLVDVWRGPAVSRTYPPLVWAYLSMPEFSNAGRRAIREGIAERWIRSEGLGADPALVALLLGQGGRYDADALRTRAAMLDQIADEVDLANQDVAALAAELLRN
jgi:hypothetical protein